VTEPDIDPDTGRRTRTGRPTLLTEETADTIVRVVSAGSYLKTAAQFAGVSQSTLMAWLARGRAAAAQVEAHPEGHSYCPSCGTDRTEDVRVEESDNELQAARYEAATQAWRERQAAKPESPDAPEEPPPARSYAVLGQCPTCHTNEYPAPWELPEAEEPFLNFLERVTVAETQAEVAAVTHWRRAFSEDWRAARDYLGRKRPEQWAAKTTVAISSDEAEARIEAATLAALTALGVDTDGLGMDDPLGDLDLGDLDGEPEE
jgi:hypothetical protein